MVYINISMWKWWLPGALLVRVTSLQLLARLTSTLSWWSLLIMNLAPIQQVILIWRLLLLVVLWWRVRTSFILVWRQHSIVCLEWFWFCRACTLNKRTLLIRYLLSLFESLVPLFINATIFSIRLNHKIIIKIPILVSRITQSYVIFIVIALGMLRPYTHIIVII